MAIKPILFSTPMVQAILDGRKTMTRRAVKFLDHRNPDWTGYIPDGAVLYGSNNAPAAKAPYKPGDILWVRETWQHEGETTSYDNDGTVIHHEKYFAYKEQTERMRWGQPARWRPSTYMPKAAARIFLRVTAVRVERVQDITYLDAEREGVGDMYYDAIANDGAYENIQWNQDEGLAVHQFARLWDSINAKRDGGIYEWEKNPWVWVYTFERIGKPEGWCAG